MHCNENGKSTSLNSIYKVPQKISIINYSSLNTGSNEIKLQVARINHFSFSFILISGYEFADLALLNCREQLVSSS